MSPLVLGARHPERSATPLVVLAAVLAWYAAASVVLVAALAAERVEARTGVVLGVATAGDVTSPAGVGGVVLGVAPLLGCVLLGLGHGWALRALVPLGALAVVAFAAFGCAPSMPLNPSDMTAEQIKAAVADKSYSMGCAHTETPYKIGTIFLNFDKGVLPSGASGTVKRPTPQ